MFRKSGCLFVAAVLLLIAPVTVLAGDNPLPFGKSWMPAWYKDAAPLPCGFTYGYTHMTDEMNVTNVGFVLGGQALPPGAIGVTNVTHRTNVFMGRLDAWVLPFLNLYAFGGEVYGKAPGVRPSVAPQLGLGALPIPTSVDVAYSGHMIGIGATVAVGIKNAYVTYDINREWATVDLLTTRVPTLTQGIRVGVRGKLAGKTGAALYVGAMHMSLRNAQLKGQNFIPGLPSGSFSLVAAPKNAWNTVAGGYIEVSRRLVITAEAGFGTRKQVVISPGIRF